MRPLVSDNEVDVGGGEATVGLLLDLAKDFIVSWLASEPPVGTLRELSFCRLMTPTRFCVYTRRTSSEAMGRHKGPDRKSVV